MGSHAFHAYAPKEWNRLPLSLFVALTSFLQRVAQSYIMKQSVYVFAREVFMCPSVSRTV